MQTCSTDSKMPGETHQPCFFPKSTQGEIMSGSDETQSKLFHTRSYRSLIAVRMGWKKELFKLSGHMEMSPSILVLPLDVSVCINADSFFHLALRLESGRSMKNMSRHTRQLLTKMTYIWIMDLESWVRALWKVHAQTQAHNFPICRNLCLLKFLH